MLQFITDYNKYLVPFSVVAAIFCGMFNPDLFVHLKILGDLFINLLKLFALPLICSALVAVFGGLSGNVASLKSLSTKIVIYMAVSEVMAITIALVLFNVLQPGSSGNPDLILGGHPYQASEQSFGLASFILSMFPDNIFYSLSNFELLPVVIFSVMFGIGCSIAGPVTQPIVDLAVGVREASTKCLQGVMFFAPIGIFALVGAGVAQSHLSGDLEENFTALLAFVSVLMLGLFLQALWQLIAVVIISKQKMIDIVSHSLPVFSTAFGTSSSVATLPVAMHTADRLKSKPFVTRFMLPLCASINVGGMLMYEMSAALFFSQMLRVDLSLSQQTLLAVACVLGGLTGGGIPETSMVSLVMIFKIVNIPLSAITILLPLDRILDRLRTIVNIFGNMCGVIIVSQWTEMDAEEAIAKV